MQVTANTSLLMPLAAASARNTPEPEIKALPVTNNLSPDLVSLGQTRDEPASYDMNPVYISGLRDSKAQGPAAASVARNLLSSLNGMESGKSPFSVSSLFSQVGALSRETLEYRNEARRVQVTQESAIKNSAPDFSRQATAEGKSATLSIKTKDGDTIQISIKQKYLDTKSATLEFSFTVDGSLSEEEQKALGQLTEKLGEMGDEFFRSDTTELRNLKGIDTSVISHFSFTLRRPEANGDFVEMNYEFSVDDVAQTQTLRASDVRGYAVDITTDLKTLVENSMADTSMLQPYIDLIREATDDAKVDNKSRRFMLDAFESMFAQFMNSAPVATDEPAGATLAAFDTGLPDFQASLKSQVVHNREFYTQTAVMALTMSQETRIESVADTLLVKQESRYELTNNRFDGVFDLQNPEIKNPYYKYITEHREGSVKRMLSMTAERVNNLLIEQDVSKEKETSEYRNYKLVNTEPDNYSDRKLQQFSDTLTALSNNKQFAAINELLEQSKANSFLAAA